MKSNSKRQFNIFLLLVLFTSIDPKLAIAQTRITLKASIDTALKNNAFIKNEKLKSEYQKILIKSNAVVPMTNIALEYGQINSSFYDTKFGLAQNINFPSIYTKQKTVLNEEWKGGLIQLLVREVELKKQVSQTFFTLLYLQEKEKILFRNDSFYTEFLKKTELRFKVGEINLMEKITAETQQGQIRLQLNQLKNDYASIQIQFKYLLNSPNSFYPYEPDFKLSYQVNPDSAFLTSHPTIKLLEQQKLLSISNTSLEKSRLLPDLFLAYSNMSMIGVGADNKSYTTSTRFQSGTFGVGIPLFYGAQKAKINASKINEQIADNNYKIGLASILNEYQKALLEYLKYYQTVSYYESIALKNAGTIINSASLRYNNGEIDYLEFVIFTNHAINIQNEYLDAIKNLNESIIQLAYLSNKN